jgi:hypothetical protein
MLNWARDSDCIAGISTIYEPREAYFGDSEHRGNVLDRLIMFVSQGSGTDEFMF